MKGIPIAFLLVIVPATPLLAAEKPCVGRIVIIGNTETPDWFIHGLMGIKTGDRLQFPLLLLGQRRLERSGRFLVDTAKGIHPTVRTLRENDQGLVIDLIITVEELPRNAFVPAEFDAARYLGVTYAHYYIRHGEILFEDVTEFARSFLK